MSFLNYLMSYLMIVKKINNRSMLPDKIKNFFKENNLWELKIEVVNGKLLIHIWYKAFIDMLKSIKSSKEKEDICKNLFKLENINDIERYITALYNDYINNQNYFTKK